MSTQKALVVPEKQGQWKVIDLPIPTPGPKDVLVKIVATALNPADWKIREYAFCVSARPMVPVSSSKSAPRS